MKFLILTLVLATIAGGSQSFVLQDDPAPVSMTAKLIERINTWEDGIEKAGEKMWEILTETHTFKTIKDMLDDEEEEVEEKKNEPHSSSDGQTSEPEDVLDKLGDIVSDSIDLIDKLADVVSELENATDLIADEADSALEALVAPMLEPLLQKVYPILQPMLENIEKKFNEGEHKLYQLWKGYLKNMDDKLLSYVQSLQESQKTATK